MKILMLDIDGVLNSEKTLQRTTAGYIGIDPHLAFLIGKITLAIPDLKIVLSSTWRLWHESKKEVEKRVCPLFDVTPHLRNGSRGEEIQAWLDAHPEVEKYAILDDDTDMLESQLPNFFQTFFHEGLTEEIMEKVIEHLKD